MSPADLKARRIALGYSVRGFAKYLGVNPSTITRWENGSRRIPHWIEKVLK